MRQAGIVGLVALFCSAALEAESGLGGRHGLEAVGLPRIFWLCGRALLCPRHGNPAGGKVNSNPPSPLLLASYSPLFHIAYTSTLTYLRSTIYQFIMSTSTAPAPASPFEARPEADQSVVAPPKDTSSLDSAASTTSDSTLVNECSAAAAAAPAAPKAELTGGHKRISYPLTSFESTPHNVSAFGFALGIVFTIGLVLASAAFKHKTFLWGQQSVSSLEPQGLWAAITNPVVGIYLAFWATFHMLEFQVTSIYNPGKLSVDCE